jgi:hypothetical protein
MQSLSHGLSQLARLRVSPSLFSGPGLVSRGLFTSGLQTTPTLVSSRATQAPLFTPHSLLTTTFVRWDSTRRKRIKAMTKHKYEKRQKRIRSLNALNQKKK